jgi:hypothetical protein
VLGTVTAHLVELLVARIDVTADIIMDFLRDKNY